MKAPLIKSFQITGPLVLAITWSTGETLSVDLAPLVNRNAPLFPLADPKIFGQAVVEEWGHGIDWPEGIDLGADRLYELGREQSGLFSPASFDRWITDNNLSLSSAAEAIGMTRRMIAHYRSGTRPIPKTVQLACIGWETLHGKKAA
jgi:hypothetical protein